MERSDALREYERNLTQLAELMAQSDERTEAKREILDRLEDLSTSLTAEDMDWLNNLSGDLYQLEGSEARLESRLGDIEAAKRLAHAFGQSDWLTVLSLLRRTPPSVPESTRAYLRYRAYSATNPGLRNSALAFLDYASQTETRPNAYKVIWLQEMQDVDWERARQASSQIIWDGRGNDPRLVVMAASIVQKWLIADEANGIDQRPNHEALLGIVLDAMSARPLPADVIGLGLLVGLNCLVGLDANDPQIGLVANALGQAIAQDAYTPQSLPIFESLFLTLYRLLADRYERLGHADRWKGLDLARLGELVRGGQDSLAASDLASSPSSG